MSIVADRVASRFSQVEQRENAWARITGCHGCAVGWIASTGDNLENVFVHADAVLYESCFLY